MHIDAKLWLLEHFEREKSKAAPPPSLLTDKIIGRFQGRV